MVFDVTDAETFKQIDFWLTECKSNGQSYASIFLIGNKTDMESRRQISYAEAMGYAKKNGITYMEVSAKSSYNIQECFLDLTRDIYLKI